MVQSFLRFCMHPISTSTQRRVGYNRIQVKKKSNVYVETETLKFPQNVRERLWLSVIGWRVKPSRCAQIQTVSGCLTELSAASQPPVVGMNVLWTCEELLQLTTSDRLSEKFQGLLKDVSWNPAVLCACVQAQVRLDKIMHCNGTSVVITRSYHASGIIKRPKPSRALTLGVADAAVADARAAASLHGLQVLIISEVSLLHGGREILNDSVEFTQHGVQIVNVLKKRWKAGAE